MGKGGHAKSRKSWQKPIRASFRKADSISEPLRRLRLRDGRRIFAWAQVW